MNFKYYIVDSILHHMHIKTTKLIDQHANEPIMAKEPCFVRPCAGTPQPTLQTTKQGKIEDHLNRKVQSSQGKVASAKETPTNNQLVLNVE